MKATLEFDLDLERQEHLECIKATDMLKMLQELAEYLRRNEKDFEMKEQFRTEEIREKFWELVGEYDLHGLGI